MEEFRVTPWEVEGKIDYTILEKKFGIKEINEKLLERIKTYTGGELHYMLRRGIFFAHRDLNWLLDEYDKGNKFYLYTGRAPSGGMTLGHLIPFLLTKWLQEKFDVELYIQIPDEEKFLAKKNIKDIEEIRKIAYDNILDIISLGFDPKKTKIFLDTEYASVLYKQACRVAKSITFSTIKDAFGMDNQTNIGWIFYTSMQAVPAFLKSVEEGRNIPCLIPLAIDQDVHFRVARDVIGKLGYYKPAIIHGKFLPGLSGSTKMSSSNPNDAIYLTDTHEEVIKKINKAITGQQATAELQKKYGGDPEKCMVCQYYKYLFEPDDKKLEAIFEAERTGKILAGEHKKDLAERINKFLDEHKKKKEELRSKIDDYIVRA
ncbi:MAG: tryptophan--tRNA ligase [Candidatus Micrarchaeia archaeon]